MYPTPSEQLQAVRHLIERVQAGEELTAESAQLLTDAARLLRRLERSWPRRMPFLVDDSRRVLAMLSELRPNLPTLEEEIAAATERPPPDGPDAAHQRNLELRDLLARAVHALPDDADGDAGRARIAEHLRRRLLADPALNRDPIPPPLADG